MPPAAPSLPTLLRVYFPFAIAYVASYLFRGINAVLFPYLERDLGIGASDLGLLTSAYFFFFAGCQPVLGIALDRFGPRKVQIALMLVAAMGAVVFGLSHGLVQLVIGRALIGLGCAAGLMAAIKAITMWFPPERWPLLTGLHMAAGGLGYMAATRPVEWSLGLTNWQGLFFWTAGFCLLVVVLMLLVVPERPPGGKPGSLRQQVGLTLVVLRDAFFWRIQPILIVQQIAYIAVLFLWIGPWLRDVAGIGDRGLRADLQLLTALAMTIGFIMSGILINALRRRGMPPLVSSNCASLAFAAVCLWLALAPPVAGWAIIPWLLFAFLGAQPIQYMSLLAAAFPVEIAGRVSTSCNLIVFTFIFAGQWGIGAVLDLWPRSANGYAAEGYAWTLGTLAVLQVLGLLWMLMWRPRPMLQRAATAWQR
jgi:predicted MFS family arabinose efflux permease